jgi:hypothetical protein
MHFVFPCYLPAIFKNMKPKWLNDSTFIISCKMDKYRLAKKK